MNAKCVRCKGKGDCGREFCPIFAKARSMYKVKQTLTKEDIFGSAPAPFVGRFGYPNVNVGILSPSYQTEDAWEYDAPNYWAEHNYQIPQLVDLRSALINSRFKANIKNKSKMLQISQEVGMASKPVDIEIKLKKKPSFRMNFEPYVAPMGPNASIEKAKLTENPKIHTKVDKVFSDTDLKANSAMVYLYKSGFNENFLSEILSVGTLGIKTDRKLVPTRWSITATDDAISKSLLVNIKQYQQIDYCSYFGGYLGNYYLILFFPDIWAYELFETYVGKSVWHQDDKIEFMTDHEFYQGRKDYAENCAGGYYAARLPICEKLDELKKQGTVLCLRFITGEYSVPLGVWVVREATRKALKSRPIYFAGKDLMLKYARLMIKKKFGVDLDIILRQSVLLKEMKEQKKLAQFA
ncbi:hypothetical protein KY312_03025 [Candidatus Woesearchaeota archaeon]|nr:hypothetical protein [Candidatus Woesearchaeota archaeon]